jgi:hypothetical protein
VWLVQGAGCVLETEFAMKCAFLSFTVPVMPPSLGIDRHRKLTFTKHDFDAIQSGNDTCIFSRRLWRPNDTSLSSSCSSPFTGYEPEISIRCSLSVVLSAPIPRACHSLGRCTKRLLLLPAAAVAVTTTSVSVSKSSSSGKVLWEHLP